jgi:2-polyprenyl-3-methyl-5-hydroxy-6-metoxy-1,4-benzoquinol methylase
MSETILYTHCPACGSPLIQAVFSAVDHTVSGESFSIWQCNNCSLRFTQDVPDARSIGRYYKSENYISHTNTSKGLINRIYQSVRKKTLKQKAMLVQHFTLLEKGALLDMGSGVGAFVHEMKMRGWNVTGLEPDPDARDTAKKSFGCELLDAAKFYDLPPASFDAITLWHVLEHVHPLHEYIEQLKKLLKPFGRIIIAVPNYTSYDAKKYRENWAAYDVPRHLYHFSPLSMQMLLKKHGLQLLEELPMRYDSYYISLLSSKYKNGRSNWPAAVWMGLRSNRKAAKDVSRSSSVIYVIGK